MKRQGAGVKKGITPIGATVGCIATSPDIYPNTPKTGQVLSKIQNLTQYYLRSYEMGCKNMEKCKLIKAKLRRIGNSMGVILPANVITGYNKGDVITLDVITKDADVITPVEDANMLDLETVEGINDRPRVRPSSDWHSPEGESICKDLLSQLGEKPKTRQELIQHVSDVGGEVSYVKRDGKIEDVHIAKPQNKNPMMVGYDPLAEDE